MPRYRLSLYDGLTSLPEDRDIDVPTDEDADDMARISLLATMQFTLVEIWRDDVLVGTRKRDSCHPDG